MFEGSTASGTERAYRKAMDKLTELLVAEGAIHAVRLKQKSKTKHKKKIAAAIYEYQADCDGELGEISFNIENSTAGIIGHQFSLSWSAIEWTLAGFLAIKLTALLILSGRISRQEIGT